MSIISRSLPDIDFEGHPRIWGSGAAGTLLNQLPLIYQGGVAAETQLATPIVVLAYDVYLPIVMLQHRSPSACNHQLLDGAIDSGKFHLAIAGIMPNTDPPFSKHKIILVRLGKRFPES